MSFNQDKKEEAKKLFIDHSSKVEAADVSSTSSAGHKKFEDLDGDPPGPLEELWQSIKDLISLLKDYSSGRYPNVPWTTVASITAAIAYFVSPIDLIPDVIPIIGYLDDAYVIKLCIDAVQTDLNKYLAWKARQKRKSQ